MKNWCLTKREDGDVLFSFLSDFFGVSDAGKVDILPALDVCEKDNKIVVKTELPGMDKKDVDLKITDDILTISGEKRSEAKDEKDDYYRIERSFGKFQRNVRLPSYAKKDDVSASYKDGVLTVEIPCAKDHAKEGKTIEIK